MRIRAPSRLHLGLIRTSCSRMDEVQRNRRYYGGIGLMVDSPEIEVCVNKSHIWTIRGQSVDRVLGYIKRIISRRYCEDRPLSILVEKCPDTHVGLGVGTQLALAVGIAILSSNSNHDYKVSTTELAKLLLRGKRSAVGAYGFSYGGMIVEYGKDSEQSISPLVSCVRLPLDWRIILLRSHCVHHKKWFGKKENEAINGSVSYDYVRLVRLIEMEILPAASMGDFKRFSHAIFEYNYLCGVPFKRYQGGDYAPETEEMLSYIRSLGIYGCGQSSWGPTAFAFVENNFIAARIGRLLGNRFSVHVTNISSGYTTSN
ncbi:MAG: hypothetical protein QXT45_06935 [Candidatus Bilamarchaeaceae archaeon]